MAPRAEALGRRVTLKRLERSASESPGNSGWIVSTVVLSRIERINSGPCAEGIPSFNFTIKVVSDGIGSPGLLARRWPPVSRNFAALRAKFLTDTIEPAAAVFGVDPIRDTNRSMLWALARVIDAEFLLRFSATTTELLCQRSPSASLNLGFAVPSA
jgi:hypothetical protein